MKFVCTAHEKYLHTCINVQQNILHMLKIDKGLQKEKQKKLSTYITPRYAIFFLKYHGMKYFFGNESCR